MQRHPGLVHGQDVLRARDRIDYATAGKQVPDRQRAAKWGRRQFVKDAANAERTSKRPSVLRRLAADDSVNIQQMPGDGLNRLR